MDNRLVAALERLMFEAVGMTTRILEETASPGADLTLAQWRVLVIAGQNEQRVRVGEIASRIGASVPSASRLVRRLERQGLVVAERDELDRRATAVRLTRVGERVRENLLERRRELIARTLAERSTPLPAHLADDLEALADALARYA